MACFAVSCCCERVSLSRYPKLLFLLPPSLVDRNKLPVTVIELVQLLVCSWILSSLVSERVFFFVLFGLLCCVLGRVSLVLVVGCGCVVKLVGTSPSILAKCGRRRRVSWRLVRCLIVVSVVSSQNDLLRSNNQRAGLFHSGSSVVIVVCDVEPKWPPQLRQ